MVDRARNGKIITFYSYKGGTGRSMALANVAWILASKGKRVLTVDWDLEAPGLHRYFYPFLADKDLTSSDGLIDFVLNFTTAAIREPTVPEQSSPSQPGPPETTNEAEWYKPYANILRYASSLTWKFENGGTLDFIPAGRQGPSYSTRVNSFNWQNFYDLLGGGTLFELAKEKMRSEYDYILIDSRTGVSDTSGICTIQMPDILVIGFTLNNQSIEGAATVAQGVFQQRARSGRAIQIFPVPMRLENAEKLKLQQRKDYAKSKFKLFPNTLPGEERENYWGNVPVIYVPYYAYEEILAAFGDNSADRISILAAAEQLTSYLTNREVDKLVAPSEVDRLRILTEYEGGPSVSTPADEQNRFAESIFGSLIPEDRERVRRVFTRLVRVAQSNEIGGDVLLKVKSRDIEPKTFSILRPLIDARLLELEQDSATADYTVRIAEDSLVQNWKRLRGWIDTDREFLVWRQRLQLKLEEWERSERDAGALLDGKILDEAKHWLETRGSELNNSETLYIKDSIEDKENRTARLNPHETVFWGLNWERTLRAVGLGLALAVVVIVFYIIVHKWRDDKRIATYEAEQVKHNRAMAQQDFGIDQLKKRNFEAAIQAFTNALQVDSTLVDAYMNRADARRRNGDLNGAIKDLDIAITLNPNYPNLYFSRALAYRAADQKVQAITDLEKVGSISDSKWWIVRANQQLDQLRNPIPVQIYYFPGGLNSDQAAQKLEAVGYSIPHTLSTKISRSVIYYYLEDDEPYAEDIQELIQDIPDYRNARFTLDIVRLYQPRPATRIEVFLP